MAEEQEQGQEQGQASKKGLFTPRNIIIAVVVLWIVISIPAWFFQTNPPVQNEPAWDSDQTRALAQRACFDCHSNETKWPLYSRVAPLSYWINLHVLEGREELNFSEWGTASQEEQHAILAALGLNPTTAYANGDEEEGEEGEGEGHGEGPGEIVEVIEEGEMPLPSYLIAHPEARLTDAEKQQLIDGFKATFSGQRGGESGSEDEEEEEEEGEQE